ncbi:MAG: Lrp/AsnC family transcriptional regulator [Angelakisella sp.]|nr:Lrp/AsnC family transcriptional regulator [Angelakisella sp.]
MEELLRILSENARLSFEQLAAMTGRTPQEVAAAMEELEAQGIIKGYRAVVDWDKTHRDLCIARIEIKVTPKSGMGFEEIANTIAQFDEVEEVTLMSGSYDLALTVTGKSFKEVAMFVSRRLAPLDSVQSTATHFVLRRYKEAGIVVSNNQRDEREVYF